MITLDQLNEDILVSVVNRLKGTSTFEENELIRKWLSESDSNKRLYDEICDIWNATSRKDKDVFETKEALKKVRTRIRKEILQHDQEGRKQGSVMRIIYEVMKIAAMILVFFTAGFYVNHLIVTKRGYDTSVTEITAPIGSKSQILLPDSTKVWLNSGSTIRYNNSFGRVDRTVSLEGEAYFDVMRNEEKCFIVTTEGITIKVLGTAFNLKAYPNEKYIETTLVRGSLVVEQHKAGREVTETHLEPNQRAVYIKKDGNLFLSDVEIKASEQESAGQNESLKGNLLLSKQVDTHVFTAWKDNQLVFRNELFESLAIKLERWYNVNIEIRDDEIKNYHFTGTIENETIQDVMEIIKYTLPIDCSFNHNTITISKGNRH